MEQKSSDTDLVSEADREAERTLAEILGRERPEDGLLGEEAADEQGTSGRRWIVDPLDGTTNYLYGLSAWCVSVALEGEDGLLVGVIHDPVGRETFRAARGRGAEVDGQPLEVRKVTSLEDALLATGFGYDPDERGRQAVAFGHVVSRVRDVRRAGSAALDLAWVAAGRLDGYWERGGKVWDWAAGRLIVSEAGGACADLDGTPEGLAVANPTLLPEILSLIERGEAQ